MDRTSYQKIRSELDFSVSRWAWTRYVAIDGLIIGTLVFSVDRGGWLAAAAPLLLAVLMFRGFGFMHDAAHGLVAKNRTINNLLGLFWGTACLLPFDQWRTDHLEHHYWSGNMEKDPVMKLVLFVQRGGRMPAIFEICWRLWLPILALMQEIVFWRNGLASLRSKAITKMGVASVTLPIAVWGGAIWLGGPMVALTFFAPALFLYLLMVEIVNIPHHLDLPMETGEARVAVYDQHKIARSCAYPRWFERFVVVNFNYHVEHHLYPTLPWTELRHAHGLVKRNLGADYNMDPGFAWIARNRTRSLTYVLYHPVEQRTAIANSIQAAA